jgi:hypothetical protein
MSQSESSSGFEVFFDFDGLFFTLLSAEEKQAVNILKYFDTPEAAKFLELQTTYYFEMRNSFALFEPEGTAVRPQQRQTQIQKIQLDMMGWAAALAATEMETRKPVQPWWLDIFNEKVRTYMPEYRPLLDHATFKVIHDGYLTARADKDANILVSSKLKPFFNCFNIVVITAEYLGGHPEYLQQMRLDEFFFSTFFPYFLQPEIGSDLMRLPVIQPPDKKHFFVAKRIAELQTSFLLLHELGHVFLEHHLDETKPRLPIDALLKLFPNTDLRLYQEFEADAFAILALREWPRENYNDLSSVAIEYLFTALTCMHETRSAVRRLQRPGFQETPNWYEKRRSVLRTLPIGDGWGDKDMRGWAELSYLFEQLYLEKLKSLTLSDLEKEIRHRKGDHAA